MRKFTNYIDYKNYNLKSDKIEAIETVNFWNIWKEGGFDKKEVIADMQYVPTWLDKENMNLIIRYGLKLKVKSFI